MTRTTLSQRVVVNLHLRELIKRRPRRKRQSQINLTRQSGLRLIPTMFPVYINPSVTPQSHVHEVEPVRLRSSQVEHPGLTTRQPVEIDPSRVSESVSTALSVQPQTPSKPVQRPKVRNPVTGQMVSVGSNAYRAALSTGYFDADLNILPGKEEIVRNWIKKHRKTNR